MAILGTRKKKRGRPKGSKNQKPKLVPVPFNPELPAQSQPILAEPVPEQPAAELPPENPPAAGGTTSQSFEAEIANIPDVVGDVVPAGEDLNGGGAGQPGGEVSPAVSQFTEAIQPAAVERWIGVPFDAIAAWMQQPEMSLEEWEKTLWAPAVSSCLQRYLPALLQKTNQPELAALALCASTYVIGRYKAIAATWKKPKEENPRAFDAKPPARPVGLAGVTTTQVSAE